MKTKLFTFSCLLLAIVSFGQQNYWSKLSRNTSDELRPRWTTPKTFSLYQLELANIKNDLKNAPKRFSGDESLIMKFPDADGNTRNYIVQEASIMEPALQAQFPDMRTYVGWQQGNKLNTIRFSVTPQTGISIMYFDGWEVSYLDSYTKNNSSFILYKRKDLPANDRLFECHVEDALDKNINLDNASKAPLVSDGFLRTYRIALSATGEYTTFHGGTVPSAMAAMVTTMTRVNGIYEKTISTTMVMVANNSSLIYVNAATDPFTNGAPGTMIIQNQSNTTTIIGSANYDIGHVFGTNSGGLAGLGVVCISAQKARGVTGSGAPIGDPFDIDYVAHEVGHQFGANHTFRNCGGNENSSTAYEPGSGSTIMAYAGICGSALNVQNLSSPYFHAASVVEMNNVIKRASDCSVRISNNNGVPTADAGADYIIPKGTAFVLTGTATDPTNDPLTYLWEQYDNALNTQPPSSTDPIGPVYRSLLPSTSPMRYFPHMTSILANNLIPKWEVTPDVARTLNFSLLVNDNKITGNQSANDAMMVTVTSDGPFAVTSQPTNISYSAANPVTVTWNVAGTNAGTINTQNVTILLSKDNGLTFNTVLAASVANNGSAVVNLPNENIASARIMVKAVGNIYFALNPSFFSVTSFLGTSETKETGFSIFPNPAKDEVNVRMKNQSDSGKYSIYDMSGKLINSGDIKGDTKIRTDAFLTGTYIITINLKNGEIYNEKLIIKK
ncbi:M12 family metallo-peptidase [Chryseobacterium wangxinyae]|uniref:reprolysin-like metallopeptidase n=1 Tax=Chryseobacterium sp. CY350 TaxID=2997336 RepID=UPI00226D64ED|nr:zinc-dependent metalloprotease family protein [Chryseobacterium sp. CY350]MCY0978930.1 M12 family metallo-peptidase [Chryseobacterium sp. CY350]WBZ97340.1 M12 family metallo-peptidase [Chryseobacterium sp. CY350]